MSGPWREHLRRGSCPHDHTVSQLAKLVQQEKSEHQEKKEQKPLECWCCGAVGFSGTCTNIAPKGQHTEKTAAAATVVSTTG